MISITCIVNNLLVLQVIMLCNVSVHGTTFNKQSQAISDITLHPVPDNADTVNFNFNQISDIPHDFFSGKVNIRRIHLEYNQLSVIHPKTFSDLVRLYELRLNNNQLTSLSVYSLSRCASPYIYIQNNPLQCDQGLCGLKKGESNYWLSLGSQPSTRCSSPSSLNNRAWNTLTEADLNCPGDLSGELTVNILSRAS